MSNAPFVVLARSGKRGSPTSRDATAYHTQSPSDKSPRSLRRLLPTRVSRACERCRHNKSRCDTFRPCSNCRHANVECVQSTAASKTTNCMRQKLKRPKPFLHSEVAVAQLPAYLPTDNDSEATGVEQPEWKITQSMDGQGDGSHAARSAANMVVASAAVDYKEAESTMGIARKIFQLGSQNLGGLATSAMPDGEVLAPADALPSSSGPSSSTDRLPILSVLGCALPSENIMRSLLEEYFDSIHWFSLVVYEPKFRVQFESICDGFARPAQDAFLLFLCMVLGISAWYRSKRDSLEQVGAIVDWSTWASKLIKHTESRLFDILEQSSLTTVQTCILLGSYNSYHGRPKSAFALLGAAIKVAQAMGLHRDSPKEGTVASEERKRIWWTIYTWDRWASTTYGRPLGINDKDCNVSMPGDVYERRQFKTNGLDQENVPICYSAYQRELNKLYIISSPLIKSIFGTRLYGDSVEQMSGNHYLRLMENISGQLSQWRDCLPSHLIFDLDCDINPDASAMQKAFHLQALALQLTFDHLVIILHRPSLVQQLSSLSWNSAGKAQEPLHTSSDDSPKLCTVPHIRRSTSLTSMPPLPDSEEWWSAALRTARVTKLPQIARIAVDGHLVTFLAINLFNSAIVMVVCALSDPLSDRAQEAKQNITRIWRLQEHLGKRSKLSMQSSFILRDVVWMVVRREGEAMLAPVQPFKVVRGREVDDQGAQLSSLLSVEDALRLPINLPSDQINSLLGAFQENLGTLPEETLRLNESLISLQRVFPGNESFAQNPGGVTECQGIIRNEEELWHENSEDHTLDISACSVPQYSATDDDLYWIWNFMAGTTNSS